MLANVVARYGGEFGHAQIEADSASPTISNSTSADAAAVGLRLQGSNSTLTSDTFQNNVGAAISMDAGSNPVVGAVTGLGNGASGIVETGGTLSGSVAWTGQGLPYSLSGGLSIPSGDTLTIGANSIFAGTDNTNFSGSGAIANAGTFVMSSTDNGTMYVAPQLTNAGTVQVRGGTLKLSNNLINNGEGALNGNPAGTLAITGNLGGNTTNADQFGPGSVNLNGSGTSSSPQTIEAMSADQGAVAAGFSQNFAYFSLTVSGSTYVQLVDSVHNSTGTGAGALYVDNLIVQSGATLNLNGLHLYTQIAQISGSVINGTVTTLPSGGPLVVNTTSSATLTASATDDWTFFGRAGQLVTIIANTGSGSNSAVPLPPTLNYAQVTLLNPSGGVVASTSNTTSGANATLTGIALSVDGTYQVQVAAPTAQSSSTGNYDLTVWDATPQLAALNLGQTATGAIADPYQTNGWTFTGTAGQVVQFNLISSSNPAITYDLTGPNGYTAFANATASSAPITLPAAGTYVLTAHSAPPQTGAYAFQLVNDTITNLTLGAPVTETIHGTGQSQYFELHITQPGQVELTLQDSTSADENQLYVNLGSVPTVDAFHPWYFTGASASKQLSIPTATPGNYFILVYNDLASAPGNQYTLEAQAVPFTLSSFAPGKVGSATAATLLVNGSFPLAYQSATAYQIQFITGGGSILPVSPLYLAPTGLSTTSPGISDGSITMSATLPANTLPAGTYSVRITDSLSNTQTLTNALTVTSSGTGVLKTSLDVPNPVGYHVPSTLFVTYTNVGTAPMPAPLLVVTATMNGQQGAFLSLNSSLAGLGYWTNTTPAGFSQTVQFLASGAIPGILEPGETATIPVYDGGWLLSQWDLSRPPIYFTVGELDTTNTQTINWSTLAAGLRPGSINTTAWAVISPILTANLGSTWGQYVQTLDNDAAYLAGIGEPIDNVNQLLSFETEKANAEIIAQTLVSVSADSMPAPGLSLTFEQSFQQSISGRYTEGILGYGWTNNWDTSAVAMPNGDVAIQSDGAFSYFSLQPNGSFAPEPGEEGTTLTLRGGAYQLVAADGSTTLFNTNGTLAYVQDTHGNRITAGYNGQNQLVSLTDSNGEYIDLSYNNQGHLSQLTDSNGQTETYGYDATGQFLTSYTDIYGTTNYTYVTGQSAAQDNALAEIAYAVNTQIFFGYDSQGRLIGEHLNSNAQDETISYLNPGGYVTTDADGNHNTTYFNLFGATAETIDPLGNVTRYYYDSNLDLTKIIGPGGSTEAATYDANGNLTSETDPLGLTTTFAYDANNNLISYTDAKGNATGYAYDSQNDLLSVTYANGTQQQATYNPLGEATQLINANGQAIDSTYNADGLVATQSFAGGTSYSYTYDARGNLLTATDASGTTQFSYTNAANPDLLTKVTYPDGTFLDFTYDAIGRRTQSVDQTGFTVNYTYNAEGQLTELTDGNDNLVVQYIYDAAGNLIQKDNGNGTFTVYTFDRDGELLSITNYAPSTGPTLYVPANSTINSFDTYTYDQLGNELTDTNQDGQWVYTYDADSQLSGAVFTPNNSDPDHLTTQDLQYAYDDVGNRISETVNSVITTYVVNNVNEYTTSVTNGVTTNYRYDADGNLVSQIDPTGTTNYSFNELDELTAVNGSGLSTSYGYNALGNQNSQTINGVTTSFEIDPTIGGGVVTSFGAGRVLAVHYTYGFGLVSQVSAAGTAAYYDFNNIGSTVGITGTAGSYVNQYGYLPFGQTTTITAALANPFTFVGQAEVMSDGSGTFTMGFRQFDPSIGQFISTDPLGLAGGNPNTRTYARNNPVQLIDPSGMSIGFGFNPPAALRACKSDYEINNAQYRLPGLAAAGYYVDSFAIRSGAVILSNINSLEKVGSLTWKSTAAGVANMVKAEVGKGWKAFVPGFNAGVVGVMLWDSRKEFLDPSNDPLGGDYFGVYSGGCTCQCPPTQTPTPPTGAPTTTTTTGVTSQDPNAMIGPAGYGTSNFVAGSTLLPYEIEFENSPTATAPAQRVDITDQLSSSFNWGTLQLTAVGFGSTYIDIPAGLQNYSTTVSTTENGQTFNVIITLSLNPVTGLLTGSFQSIDPTTDLPPASLLTGFLPAEDGSGNGTGFVDFSILPKLGLTTGTLINNVANITFDQGEIIATDQINDDDPGQGINPALEAPVTIDSGPPTSTVAALPASSPSTFTVNWSGQDDIGGSGIASYNVYVSDNSGPFTLWQSDTTLTSASYTGVAGQTYGFYSVATDNVGNVQSTPSSAQTSTTVSNLPFVTAISPSTGPAGVKTNVTITGQNLSGATAVKFGTVAGTIVSDTATQIVVTSPAGALGKVDITVTTSKGTSATSAADKFTFVPTVKANTTSLAATATTLTITGTSFSTTAANDKVTFSGGATGTVTTATATTLTVTSLKGLIAGKLMASVAVSGVSSASVEVANVTPVITSSTATHAANAASLTIKGVGFSATAANDTVKFNNGATGKVTAATSTSLTVTSLTGLVAGSLTAIVTSNGASNATAVRVATVTPVVTKSTANLGVNATSLVIHGFGFSTTAANDKVTFSGEVTGTVTSATTTAVTITKLTGLKLGALTASVTVGTESSGTAVQVATVAPVVTVSTTNLAANATTLTIKGFGFSTTASSDKVTFSGGATGTVTTATATTLTVTSLKGLIGGKLLASVSVSGTSSGAAVQVATVVPMVTKSTTSLAPSATTLTINGFGFDPTAAHDTVVFSNGVTGTVSTATNNQLVIINLTGLVAGALTAVGDRR